MIEPIPTPEELQKLCEQLIACRCWTVLALDDRAYVYDKDKHNRDAILILHPSFWSFRVELFGVEVKVSNPRRLWKMIHARDKENEAVFHARALMEVIEKAREVVRTEVRCSDGKEEQK